MTELRHIASLVLRARPEAVQGVRQALAETTGAEIHAADGGKLVVTLETANESELAEEMTRLGLLDGVLSAVLVYHEVAAAEDLEENIPC
jgi:periplasmic nitrate reductase NapD